MKKPQSKKQKTRANEQIAKNHALGAHKTNEAVDFQLEAAAGNKMADQADSLFTLQLTYFGSFIICSLLSLYLCLRKHNNADASDETNKTNNDPKFRSFQLNYLFVFTIAMFSDWLQGPYVYELYVSYGFNQQEIAELFVCGFGSSMLVGTIVGGLADKYGRKVMCILYCICYILACFTKLVPEYWILMIGRFLSGISTSLLFSVFESWMVCEHNKLGFDSSQLGETFSYATFGNGLAAVVAGLGANIAAESFGYVAPFVVAIIPLSVVALVVYLTWTENFGDPNHNIFGSFSMAFQLITNDMKICYLAMAQSCFEGAMYTFVFMWTPALKTAEESEAELKGLSLEVSTSQYLGLIFACFMVCVMVGSSIFKVVSADKKVLYKIPLALHAIAFGCMLLVTVFFEYKFIVYLMFLLFEISVGVFYPAYGVIKSEKVPEEIRSSVMNIFRIPLNAFVVIILLKIKYLSPQIVFAICTITHGISFFSYYLFYSKIHHSEEEADLTTKDVLLKHMA